MPSSSQCGPVVNGDETICQCHIVVITSSISIAVHDDVKKWHANMQPNENVKQK